MAQQTINVGTADKGNGDPLRTAFIKVNNNFNELYAALGADFENLETHLIPKDDDTYDLGSPTKKWRSLYVGANTIYLDNTPLTVEGGVLKVNGDALSAATGNVGFVDDRIYDLNGLTISNDDLVHGATARLSIPAYGDNDPVVLLNYYGGLSVITGNSPSSTHGWTFNAQGDLELPNKWPIQFTAVFDAEHYNGGGTFAGDGTASIGVQLQGSGAQFQWLVDDPLFSTNRGYVGQQAFRYTEADHGITGFNVDILMEMMGPDVDTGEYSLQIAFSPAPGANNLAKIRSSDELIVSAGDKGWIFDIQGNVYLPAGGDIVDSTGTSVLGGGNANTGDVTFSGVKVIGAGTASGDGAGYSTLELVPDNNLYGNNQYLVIDPTAPSHIHIRAGGTQDASNAELFLGGEKNHVKVNDYAGVRLQNERLAENFYYYSEPTNFTAGGWYQENGNWYVEFTTTDQTMINHFWEFTNGGQNRIVLNQNDTLEYGGSASNPSPNFYKIQVNTGPLLGVQPVESIEFQLFTTQTNNIILENSDFRVDVYDDIRMFGRDVFRLANYSIDTPIEIVTNYDANSHTWAFEPNGDLTLPNSAVIRVDGSNIEVANMTNFNVEALGVVNVYTDTNGVTPHQWQFGDDGNLTIPGDIHGSPVISGGAFPSQVGRTVNITPADDASDKKFKFRIDQYGETFTRAYLEFPTAEVDKQVAAVFPHTNGKSGYIYTQGADTNGQGMNDAFNIFYNSGDIKITSMETGGAGTLRTWKFGNDGILTLPNSTTIGNDLAGEYASSFLCLPWGVNDQTSGLFSSNGTAHPIFDPLIATVAVGWFVSGPGLTGVKEITQIVEMGDGDRAFIVDLTDGSLWADLSVQIPYRFYSPDYSLVYNGTRLTVDSNEWNFTQAGDLTIPGNINEKAGNDLEIAVHNNRNNDGTPGSAVLSLTNNDAVDFQTYTTLEVGAYDIKLNTDYEGVFTGTRRTWEFKRDGILTFPGGATVKDLPGATTDDSVLIFGAGTTIAENQRAARIGINGSVEGVSIGAGSNDWTFTNDGTLTFPDATVQTTAWTKSAADVQSSAPSSPVTGQLWYDTDDGNTYIWTGSAWVDSNPAAAAPTVDITDTNGLTTTYYPTFVENRTTGQYVRADVDLTYRTDTNTLTTGNLTTGVLKIEDGAHEKFQTKADATGIVTHDCSSGHVFYHTSPDANWTVNLTNLNLSSGYATAVTLVIVQGATGYYPSAVQIGGAPQPLNWQANTTPTPSTNRTDVVTFSIINNSGTYTVLGQLTGF